MATTTADKKQKAEDAALELALAQIEKSYGKGSVMKMGEKASMSVEVIPTGALKVDIALDVGGLPRGRVVEISGTESAGKTTLAMHTVAEAQKAGGKCAYIDVEHAVDPVYAKAIGVDIDELLISQPDSAEEALEIADMLVRSGAIDVLVIDSVAALVPKAEIEGAMGDSHVGLQARLMSQALRKLTANISKTQTIAIFINQIREKIGVTWGSNETQPGGRALKYYSSVRIDIRRIGAVKNGEENIGNRTRVKIVKNKVGRPFRQAEFDIIYGQGVSKSGDILDLGIDFKVIKKSGGNHYYGDLKFGTSRETARLFLDDPENSEVAAELETAIREAAFAGDPEETVETPMVDEVTGEILG